jgi:hypothetical protein
VIGEPLDLHEQQRRGACLSGLADCRLEGRARCREIDTVDAGDGQAEELLGGAAGQVEESLAARRGGNRPAVVFDHEDNGCATTHRLGNSLEDLALLRRAVADAADHHWCVRVILDRLGIADRVQGIIADRPDH